MKTVFSHRRYLYWHVRWKNSWREMQYCFDTTMNCLKVWKSFPDALRECVSTINYLPRESHFIKYLTFYRLDSENITFDILKENGKISENIHKYLTTIPEKQEE